MPTIRSQHAFRSVPFKIHCGHAGRDLAIWRAMRRHRAIRRNRLEARQGRHHEAMRRHEDSTSLSSDPISLQPHATNRLRYRCGRGWRIARAVAADPAGNRAAAPGPIAIVVTELLVGSLQPCGRIHRIAVGRVVELARPPTSPTIAEPVSMPIRVRPKPRSRARPVRQTARRTLRQHARRPRRGAGARPDRTAR